MTNLMIPPGLLLVLAAFLLPLLPSLYRKFLLIAAPIASLILILLIPDDYSLKLPFLEYELLIIKLTPFGKLFAVIFSIMALVGNIYALNQAKLTELVSAMIYAGSGISVVLAGDLITLFIFWEIMAIASTMILWANNTSGSRKAGIRYLLVHLFGGVILMIGIISYYSETGKILFESMVGREATVSYWFILAGFLINAGAPPLSAWIADAYPEASPSGSVFLSAFTTKTAVYVLLIAFAGTKLLIFIGLYMVFYGIIYALLENDMRRILAYSIINQVGFMVTGIGIGTDLALNGVAAHAFAHIIYKALLIMSAGSVLYRTGYRKCTDLGGLFQTMPVTAVCGIIGALSISAFPLTSGFISKSMISSAAAYEHLSVIWYLLLAATAGVFLHAGIKFPWFVFFQKDSGLRPAEAPLNMRLSMYIFSFLCIGLGIYPDPLYSLLPALKTSYVPYDAAHVVTQIQLLLFSGLAFFILLPMMKRTLTISLDFDWFYRRLLPGLVNLLEPLYYIGTATIKRSIKTLYKKLQLEPDSRIKQLGYWSLSVEGMVWISLLIFGIALLTIFTYSTY